MECRAPDISTSGIKPTAKGPYYCDFGFIMDNVNSTNHLGDDLVPFTYYPDPEYRKFENWVKIYNLVDEEHLLVTGENLNLASDKDDVIVKIGDHLCAMMSLNSDHLTCLPQGSLQQGSQIGNTLKVTHRRGERIPMKPYQMVLMDSMNHFGISVLVIITVLKKMKSSTWKIKVIRIQKATMVIMILK
ncbi:plexin-A3-like isoform X2 [Ptychodera flava]|uniref:plexin-A3-like isoform X2 n=1 Tax=Ptychodera flava TaxID=63121 RepID=UPI00396A01DB